MLFLKQLGFLHTDECLLFGCKYTTYFGMLLPAGFHIFRRSNAELLLEAFREVRGVREPNHVAHLTNHMTTFVE